MATRFRFRLEPLLKLRKNLEQEAQRQLALKLEARNQVVTRIQSLQQEHAQGVESRRLAPGASIDLHYWADMERYLVVLEKRILLARMDLEEAEREVVEARRALTRAHQAHLTLLRLKERRFDQHTRDMLREEVREADEISVLRHRFGASHSPRGMS